MSSSTVISVNLNPYTILGNGVTTVPGAGTAVALAGSTVIKSVTIRSLSSNTGKVYVGSASVSSLNGFQLSPQETVSMDLDNLSKIYIDVEISGQGVSYLYLA